MLEPQFSRDRTCEACDLCEAARSVCLPTRPYRPLGGHQQALLMVGKAPGTQEDKLDKAFVGPSGMMLRRVYVEASGITKYADVYIANAVRCRPPDGDSKVTAKQMKACRPYLIQDINKLLWRYEHVVVLCLGSEAARTVQGRNITEAFKHQGESLKLPYEISTVGGIRPPVVFATNHPAMLLPRRNPAAIHVVGAHLALLSEYLRDPATLELKRDDVVRVGVTVSRTDMLSLDIETYGCLAQNEQTVFHPQKMVAIDGVNKRDVIVTVACSWMEDGVIRSSAYHWSKKSHRRLIRAAIRDTQCVVGHNILFDLQCLRYADPFLRRHLNRRYQDRSLRLWDTAISSYLYSEIRPEKSLKDLSPLFHVGRYERTLADTNYQSVEDPDLLKYNIEDTINTLGLERRLAQLIAQMYGTSNKLGKYCREWYSDILWAVLYMSEAGVAMDIEALIRANATLKADQAVRFREFKDHYGVPPSGTGSDKALRSRLMDIVQSLPKAFQVRVAKTPTGLICNDEANLRLVQTRLDPDSLNYKYIEDLLAYRHNGKLVTTYYRALLSGRSKSRLIPQRSRYKPHHRIFPSYYIVPSAIKDDLGKIGGTNQGRLSAAQPSIQNFPPTIKEFFISRFRGGSITAADLGQMEWRVAALLSNDPVMIMEIEQGIDMHTKAAVGMFGEDIRGHELFKKVYRYAGKRRNFLSLYRGSGETLQLVVLKDTGVLLKRSECNDGVAKVRQDYTRLWEWQEELIEEAATNGFLQLPFTGQTRAFCGSRKAVRRTYTNVICNFPVQGISANIFLSAQVELTRRFLQEQMQSRVVLCVHDSIYVDTHPREQQEVLQLIDEVLPNPPYYQQLCAHLNRRVTLVYEIEEQNHTPHLTRAA